MSAHFLDWLEQARPDSPAVGDDADVLSYAELRAQAQALAGTLHGKFADSRYLLLPATRTVEFVIRLCAVAYSGKVAVPVDPDAPAAVLDSLLVRCGENAALLDDKDLLEPGQAIDARNDSLPAMVLFTSGTSGEPKGVLVSQANLEHSTRAINAYLDYAKHPSAAVVLPLHYSYALLSQLFCMLRVGGYTRLFGSFRNPLKFAKSVNELGLASFCGVPSTYQALCLLRGMTEFAMPEVKIICSAGAAMDRSLLPQIRTIFPSARFFDNYGMTEATPRVTYIEDSDPNFAQPTCGRAIDGVELRILDEQSLKPLPDGQSGIVGLRGANVFSGYLNDPEETRRAFSPDGYLLAADLGELRDGYLFIAGRRDEIFNVGGEKVSPLEIERALNAHPGIEVAGVSSLIDGPRGRVAVAYLRLASPLTRRDLNAFLADRLPPGKIPARYFVVKEMPMTGNGKLQRNRLLPDNASLGIRDLD